jgi:hypothetical protein
MRQARVIVMGTIGGFSLGIAARAWMRFISDDPEFSWSGTVFIVLGFTIFGLAQSIGRLTSTSRRRWVPTVGRAIGIVGLLPLFVAAGGIMMPTVVAGGFAAARPEMTRRLRYVCLAIAAVPVLMVANIIVTSRLGWSLHSLIGIAMVVVLYGVVVVIARPTFAARLDGRRVHRNITIVVFAVLGLLVAGMAVGAAG